MSIRILFRALLYCLFLVVGAGGMAKEKGLVQGQISKDHDMDNMIDRAAISDQVSRYAQFWDRKDAEAFSRLFTQDGTLEWEFGGEQLKPPVISGRAEILEYALSAHEGRLAGRQSRHHFSSLVFDRLSGEQALTEHTFVVTHQIADAEPFVTATGIYRIQWQKTAEGWLMSHRTLKVDR